MNEKIDEIEKQYRKGIKLCRRRFIQELEWLKERRLERLKTELPADIFEKLRLEKGRYTL